MTTQTEALNLALEALTIIRFCVPPAQRPTIEQAITTTIEALAQPEQEQATTLYIYRQPDGSTQVMAPTINDQSLVIDMLEESIRAMTEGKPVTRN